MSNAFFAVSALLIVIFTIPLLVITRISEGFAARHKESIDQFPSLSTLDIHFTGGCSFMIIIIFALQGVIYTRQFLYKEDAKTPSGVTVVRKHAFVRVLILPSILSLIATSMLIAVFVFHYTSSLQITSSPRVPGSLILEFTLQTSRHVDLETYLCGLKVLPHDYTLYEGRGINTRSVVNLNSTELQALQKKCATLAATRWLILPYIISVGISVALFAVMAKGLWELERMQRLEQQQQDAQTTLALAATERTEALGENPPVAYWWDRGNTGPWPASPPRYGG